MCRLLNVDVDRLEPRLSLVDELAAEATEEHSALRLIAVWQGMDAVVVRVPDEAGDLALSLALF
jgi:hypothetical protein